MSDILVVVDMQNGFLRSESTQAVRKRIGTLINSGAFDYIIATKFINGVDSVYVKLFGWTELIEKKDRDLCEEVQEKSRRHNSKRGIHLCSRVLHRYIERTKW